MPIGPPSRWAVLGGQGRIVRATMLNGNATTLSLAAFRLIERGKCLFRSEGTRLKSANVSRSFGTPCFFRSCGLAATATRNMPSRVATRLQSHRQPIRMASSRRVRRVDS